MGHLGRIKVYIVESEEPSQPFQNVCRLEGELAVDNVVYSTDNRATIQDSTANIVAAFTQPVPALTAAMFDVYGVDANLTAFSKANVNGSVWTFSVTVPADYYGMATVYMNQVGSMQTAPWVCRAVKLQY